MSMKDNFYANFPKLQKGTNYMSLKPLSSKERNVMREVIILFHKKADKPSSPYLEFAPSIARAGQHLVAKVFDEADVSTFVSLSEGLISAMQTDPSLNKKGKFNTLPEIVEKVKLMKKEYYG